MSKRSKGAFVVLDGIDGCGKSLHSKLLTDGLQTRGFNAVRTWEPSESHVGKFIQTMLMTEKIHPMVEALLFAADRYQHLQAEILPSLESGKIVVCDRYLHSSLAYQGAQGVNVNWIKTINDFAVKPDIVFYLDVPASVGLARIRRKKTVLENMEIQEKVREKYLEFVRTGELFLVDANRSIEEVKGDLLKLVLERLES
jgi:dTMP kinase